MSEGQRARPGSGGAARPAGRLFHSRREGSLWLLALAYVGLIVSTLSLVRPLTELLRERQQLERFVVVAVLVLALPVLGWLLRQRPGWRQLALLAAAAGAYATLFFYLELPEERIHLPQYGLLAVIFYAALGERRAAAGGLAPRQARRRSPAPWRQALGASLLTAAAGWLDEGIQHLLPSRYYDLRDVALNAVAGTLAAFVLAAFQWSEKKPPRH